MLCIKIDLFLLSHSLDINSFAFNRKYILKKFKDICLKIFLVMLLVWIECFFSFLNWQYMLFIKLCCIWKIGLVYNSLTGTYLLKSWLWTYKVWSGSKFQATKNRKESKVVWKQVFFLMDECSKKYKIYIKLLHTAY